MQHATARRAHTLDQDAQQHTSFECHRSATICVSMMSGKAQEVHITRQGNRGEQGRGSMDEFTAKINEIRRLHEVCRAKNAAVRQAYRHEIERARAAHQGEIHAV